MGLRAPGAHGQFAAVPLNLLGGTGGAMDYIDGGFWSARACTEAKKCVRVEHEALADAV